MSHCNSEGHQKIAAWKVGWVPIDKEDFAVQQGLGLVECCLGPAWTFQILVSKDQRSLESSTFECPRESDSGQKNSTLTDC